MMATATHDDTQTQANTHGTQSEHLTDSPMMAHLLDALEKKTDIGHYGRLTFTMIARFFMDDEEMIKLLANQPGQDEEKAKAEVYQVKQRGYNPPKRERILEWQSQQEFPIIPDAENPDSGNVYRELKFPDSLYENINHYYEEKADA